MTSGLQASGARLVVAIAVVAVVVSAAPCHAQDGAPAQPFPPDPSGSRLFFGPTGRALPQGSGYAGGYDLLMPVVQVGVTDRFSIGGGTPLFVPAIPVFWISPKVQVLRGPRTQVSAGLLYLHAAGDETERVAVGYGVATVGSDDGALTVGAGWSQWRSSRSDSSARSDSALLMMIGADRRVSRRAKLIAETYASRDSLMLMAGMRLIGARVSADLGLAVIPSRHDAIAFPLVNLVWTFGHQRQLTAGARPTTGCRRRP